MIESAGIRKRKTGRPAKAIRRAGQTSFSVAVIVGTGTCSLAAVAPNGQFLDALRHVFPTPKTAAALDSEIIARVNEIQASGIGNALGIGIVVPGLLDTQRDAVAISPNITFLNGHELRSCIAAGCNLPVVLLPSMEAHHLSESAFGAARTVDDFVVINFAGGIGTSVSMNGEFLRGRLGTGIELGHITIDPNGPECGCGNHGCVEQLGSGATILRAGRAATGKESGLRRSFNDVATASSISPMNLSLQQTHL